MRPTTAGIAGEAPAGAEGGAPSATREARVLPGKGMRTREICVGTLYRGAGWVVNGQLTSRRCLMLNWRGRVDWCQPRQFLTERELGSAIAIRLGLAGLRLIQVLGPGSTAPGRDPEYEPIYCLVGRLGIPHPWAVRVNRMIQGWVEKKRRARSREPELPVQTSV